MKPKFAIFDTENLDEAITDFEEATDSEVLLFDARWAKKEAVAHASPDALVLALRTVEKDPDCIGILVDSATDVAHWGRHEYARTNPGKKIDYGKADAKVKNVEGALKAISKHWILTFREKDDKDTIDGQEVTVGKKAKAAGDIDYLARVKCHCTKTRVKGEGIAIACDLTDQRGLSGTESTRLIKPTSSDFANLLSLERYPKNGRKFTAQFHGREGTGKSGCAMRLAIALHRAYAEAQKEASGQSES